MFFFFSFTGVLPSKCDLALMYHRQAALKRLFKLCSILGLSEPTTFGTFSGKDVPSQIASNGHIMRLEFQSDHSNTGKGFNISYTSTYKLPTLFSACLSVCLSDAARRVFAFTSHTHRVFVDLYCTILFR